MAEKEQNGFEDLECYQLALKVFREAHTVARLLPAEERYNLSDQLRRAATSTILDIAEGYGRYHYLDSLRFHYIARGSLNETLSAFIACAEVGLATGNLSDRRQLCHSALRSLNGYIRYVREQQRGHAEFGDRVVREESPEYVAGPGPFDSV